MVPSQTHIQLIRTVFLLFLVSTTITFVASASTTSANDRSERSDIVILPNLRHNENNSASSSTSTSTNNSSNNDGSESDIVRLLRHNENALTHNHLTDATTLKDEEGDVTTPWYHPSSRKLNPLTTCPWPDVTSLANVRSGQYGSKTGDCFYMYYDSRKCDFEHKCPLYGECFSKRIVFFIGCVIYIILQILVYTSHVWNYLLLYCFQLFEYQRC